MILMQSRVAYTEVYATPVEGTMQRTAKIFMNNRSQAVRLPKEFQFNTSEVFIRKQGDEVVLSTRPTDWSSYLASASVASENFMQGLEDLPVQERDL
jgi:antitoxin VapB